MDWTTVRRIVIWAAGIMTAALALWVLLANPLGRLYLAIHYWLR